MTFLNSGGSRAVFLDDGRAIKYPYSHAGAEENRTEVERYASEHDPRLAECYLRGDSAVSMEYIDNRTFEYGCWKDGVQCERFDLADRRVQPYEINCDGKCDGCEHNIVGDYSEGADFQKLIGADSTVQCGYDAEGKLKVYDYGYVAPADGERTPWLFYAECAPLFGAWVAGGNRPEDFADWAMAHPDELPKRQHKPDYRSINKNTRETVNRQKIR